MKKFLLKTVILFNLLYIILNFSIVYAATFDAADMYISTQENNYTLQIGMFFTIAKMVLVTLGIIIIVIGIISYFIKIRKKDEDVLKKSNIKLLISTILGIVLLFTGGLMQLFTRFAKPIIYIYPEKEQVVNVKLGKKENITCSYPKYEDGWKVVAKPNGDLVDCKTGRNLYALYWEGKGISKSNYKEGFIIKGEDTIKFLEEKLEILGLNEREAEEFIVYWLPELEGNKYNYIRFKTMEEINENMPLEIEPKPDTIIRVMMEYKSVLIPFEVEEQKLETPERNGFTVVEWGGTRL